MTSRSDVQAAVTAKLDQHLGVVLLSFGPLYGAIMAFCYLGRQVCMCVCPCVFVPYAQAVYDSLGKTSAIVLASVYVLYAVHTSAWIKCQWL